MNLISTQPDVNNISMHTRTYTHKTNTYSPAKESPERAAVHTVFTAPLNY